MVNLVIDYMQLHMITCKFNNFIAHNSDFLSILRIHFIQLLTRTFIFASQVSDLLALIYPLADLVGFSKPSQ